VTTPRPRKKPPVKRASEKAPAATPPVPATELAVPIGPRVVEVLELAYRARRPILLEGPTGIGKSQIVAEFARASGLELVVLDLSLLEPPDLVGLPMIADGRTHYASPAELPTAGCGVLMLEELNRAEIPVMQPALQLLSARRLHAYELPPGWICVAAINPEDGDYQVNPSYLRPNRRFPQRVGEIPGRTRRPPRPELLVAIDTSGSMTGDILDRVAREVRRLAMHARLTIVECDAAVHRIYPLGSRLGPFIGGGDTDFSPVFDEARRSDRACPEYARGRGGAEGEGPKASREIEARDTQRFEGLVYFTDGKAAMPPAPPRLPVLWALTHDDPFLVDWGTIVRLPS
jgi:hypothetical protein